MFALKINLFYRDALRKRDQTGLLLIYWHYFFQLFSAFLLLSWFLIVNDIFFLVSRPEFRKSFPEYYNKSLLELIYSKCLMLSNLKFFKMSTFLLFAANWGAWREEICEADKTEFSLSVESHSHLTEGTKERNVSSLNLCFSGKNLGCMLNSPWHIPRPGLYYC